VVMHPWTGEFAEARNVGLDRARGAWILYIDADERLRPISREQVRARLEAAPEVALRVRLRPSAGMTPYWEYRLWRSDPRIRFVGKMHEKMTGAIRAVADEDRRPIGESELFLDHVGYEGDQTHKHRRNLPLLRAGLADDPNDPYSWHHLAVVLDGLGEREESEAALHEGLRVARRTRGTAGVLPFLRLILDRIERGIDPSDVLEEALGRYPDSFGLAWLKVLSDMKAGHYEEALRRLEPFDVDPDMPAEDATAYPTELFAARAAEARATCLFRLGRYEEAAGAYADVERFEPSEPAHRLKRALAEHRARRAGSNAPPPSGLKWPARALLRGLTLGIGGVPVAVSATDAMRAAAVRALFGRLAPTDEDPRARIAFGGHCPPLPGRDPDVSVGPIRLWYDGATMSIAHGRAIGARVEPGLGILGGYNTIENLTLVFRDLAPLMLAGLLGPHGRFMVHAGALQRDGRAALVIGGTGRGKSTLVLGALLDGWSVISDDLVVVCASPSGPLVTGIPKPLLVPGEVLGEQLRSSASPADQRGRFLVPFGAWDAEPRPVELVVVVDHGDSPAAEAEPIDRRRLLEVLIGCRLSPDPAHVRAYFRLAASLLDVPAFCLRHSRRPELRAREAAAALAALRDPPRVAV
jgi:tetratricopeptide (TPR) repeat protein